MNEAKEISVKYNFRLSPVLDQYLLVDSGVIERAIRYADLKPSDEVLEIGPGFGFITRELIKKAGKVIAVEKDKRLEKILKSILPALNLELIFQDFLEIEPSSIQFNKVVSAIPYSLSAPITFKLLEYNFEKAVLFYQKEFGEKMVAKPGDSEYGRLSVSVQYYFNAQLKEIIRKDCFYPTPKVDSCIMVLERKNIQRNPTFDNFIRELFRYPNKDVSNAMKIAFGKEIQDSRKVRELSIEDILELAQKVKL
ncbi:MAG: 16S rRNA (adenine(1518)-N(6)/adenine(1519)-N(6))-dimethyltransferase RsmA [archaeon]